MLLWVLCALDLCRILLHVKPSYSPAHLLSAIDTLGAVWPVCCAQVLNARFQVLQEMLDMLRDHQVRSRV